MVASNRFCHPWKKWLERSTPMTELKQFVRIDSNGPDGTGLPATVHDPSDTAIAGAERPLGYTAYTAPTAGIFTAGRFGRRARHLGRPDPCHHRGPLPH